MSKTTVHTHKDFQTEKNGSKRKRYDAYWTDDLLEYRQGHRRSLMGFFRGFLRFIQVNIGMVPQNMPQSLPSIHLPIYVHLFSHHLTIYKLSI